MGGPDTFARLYTTDLDATLAALADVGIRRVRLRFGHASGLQLVLVDSVLVLAGTDEQLAPFRATRLTIVVDDLDVAVADAVSAGGIVVRGVADQVTGRNATVDVGHGAVIEYVEWNAQTRRSAGPS